MKKTLTIIFIISILIQHSFSQQQNIFSESFLSGTTYNSYSAMDCLIKTDSMDAVFYQRVENYSPHQNSLFSPEHQHRIITGVQGHAFVNSRTVWAGEINWTIRRIFGLNGIILNSHEEYFNHFLTDTIQGDWFGSGPELSLAMAHRLNDNISFMMEGIYQIGTTFKQQYSRVKRLNYFAGISMGSQVKWSNDWLYRLSFAIHRRQDQYNFEKSWDNQSIYIRQYRSDQFYRQIYGDFERTDQSHVWGGEQEMIIPLHNHFQTRLLGKITRQSGEIFDKIISSREDEYPWYENSHWGGIEFKFHSDLLSLAILPYFSKKEYFSETTDGSVLVSKFIRSGNGLKIAVKKDNVFSLKFIRLGLDFFKKHEQLENYLDHLNKSGEKMDWLGGIESGAPKWKMVQPFLTVRYGRIQRPFEWNHFLPGYKTTSISSHLNIFRQQTKMVTISFEYERQNSITGSGKINYLKFGINYYPELN